MNVINTKLIQRLAQYKQQRINNAYRTMHLAGPKELLHHIYLPYAISESSHITLLKHVGYNINRLRFVGRGYYKSCFKLSLNIQGHNNSLAILISSSSTIKDEVEFYSKHRAIPEFPKIYESFVITAPTRHRDPITTGHRDTITDYYIIIRDFIDAPPMAHFMHDETIMTKYLNKLRSLMLRGVNVINDMDFGNLNNAFYMKDKDDFMFIDHRGFMTLDTGLFKLIDFMSRERSKDYYHDLIRIFLDVPQFRDLFGTTIPEVEESREIIHSLP